MIESDRLISPQANKEDAHDRAIRPSSLADYTGQEAVREQMEIFISAARGASGGVGSHFDFRSSRVG